MRRRRRIAALACALTLAVPSTALGQSAGDDQYQDPFSGQQPQRQGQSQGSQGGSGGGGGGGGGNSGAGAGTQSAQAAPAEPGDAAGQAESSQGATLPRTGFMAALPLVWGLVLLLSGAALKRGARSRNR